MFVDVDYPVNRNLNASLGLAAALSRRAWPLFLRQAAVGLTCLLWLATSPLAAQEEPPAAGEPATAVAETKDEEPAAEEDQSAEEKESGSEEEESGSEEEESGSEEPEESNAAEETTVEDTEDDNGSEAEEKSDVEPTEESQPVTNATAKETKDKLIIGATARFQETQSQIVFNARIDTGAESSSLHVEEIYVENEVEGNMDDNIGKTIRFVVQNGRDQRHDCKAKIVNVVRIANAYGIDRRYKVMLTFRCEDFDFEKRVEVSLNDRSHKTYPLLIGRNYLRGDFLVDVSLGKQDD